LVKIARKYKALEDENKFLHEGYAKLEEDFAGRERHLVERLERLVNWKAQASVTLKILLEKLRKSATYEDYCCLKNDY
jgi:hypothetical protein